MENRSRDKQGVKPGKPNKEPPLILHVFTWCDSKTNLYTRLSSWFSNVLDWIRFIDVIFMVWKGDGNV